MLPPPASRSQNHGDKAMTFVSQATVPMVSSCPAAVKGPWVRMPRIRRRAPSAVVTVMNPIISVVVTRSYRRSRSIRPGSPNDQHDEGHQQ